MSPAWTAADLARDLPVAEGLVVVDAAAYNGEPVLQMAPHFAGWDGPPRMRWVLHHAAGSAETPIESLGRFGCIEGNLPIPIANAWVGRHGPGTSSRWAYGPGTGLRLRAMVHKSTTIGLMRLASCRSKMSASGSCGAWVWTSLGMGRHWHTGNVLRSPNVFVPCCKTIHHARSRFAGGSTCRGKVR
jgi:hypothetical protein